MSNVLSPITVAEARARGLDCSRVLFYAFGGGYPDGSCHEGNLTDDDSDYITDEWRPCPFCKPAEYDEWASDTGDDTRRYVMVEQLGAATEESR
jgi:hypothetical protein